MPIKTKDMTPYPNLKAHLDRFTQVITSDNKPYVLHRVRDEQFFKGEKIVSLRKTAEPCFTYTDFDCYVLQSYNVIKWVTFDCPNKSGQLHLSALVDQMITAQEQLNSAISDSDKKFLQQRVDILDKQINTVVYGLYGLTVDEVKIVEGK